MAVLVFGPSSGLTVHCSLIWVSPFCHSSEGVVVRDSVPQEDKRKPDQGDFQGNLNILKNGKFGLISHTLETLQTVLESKWGSPWLVEDNTPPKLDETQFL